MARTLQHILTITSFAALTFAGVESAYAQEVNSSNYDVYASDSDRERERDRIVYTAGESTEPQTSHKSTSTVSSKDSTAITRMPIQRPVRTQPAAEPAKAAAKPKEGDDSILSFNFLYYIIQKYKLQDIVD